MNPCFNTALATFSDLTAAIMIKNTLNPTTANFTIGAIRQNGRIFNWDCNLIVITIGYPSLHLCLAELTFIHQHMYWMVNMIALAFFTQFGFKLFSAPWC